MGSSGSKPAGTTPFPAEDLSKKSTPAPQQPPLKAANDDFVLYTSEDPDAIARIEQSIQDAKRAKELYSKLKSTYLEQSIKKSKDGKTPPSTNLIEDIQQEDFDNVDHRQSLRIPPMVLKELKNVVEQEAMRKCNNDEKIMAQCLQDKMWTAWKCQKERDAYYLCLRHIKEDNDLLTALRWKYNTGTFHGEVLARKGIMQRLWREHFPDREIPHGWANE